MALTIRGAINPTSVSVPTSHLADILEGGGEPTDSFTVTKNLTHAVIKNERISGSSYYAEVEPAENWSDLTVTIKVGGVDMSNLYTSGVINIPNVTGNIVITAAAAQAALLSITAVYTQSGTVYDTDSLDSLKSDLVVTATYADSSTATVTDYTLSGTLTARTSPTITVRYGGKTDTFTVIGVERHLVYSYTDGLLTAQDYVEISDDSTMTTNPETMTPTGTRFYEAKTSSAANNKSLLMNIATGAFTSHAKVYIRAKIVSIGWYNAATVSAPGPIFFGIPVNNKLAVLGFVKQGSASGQTYIKVLDSDGTFPWVSTISLDVWHEFIIEVENDEYTVKVDGVAVISNVSMPSTENLNNRFVFYSINSGADDIYISDIEYWGD